MITWLAPDQTVRTPVADSVRECIALLATSPSFRGYAIRNEVSGLAGEVSRASLRQVLTAALIHTTDQSPPPAELVLVASSQTAGLRLELTLHPTDGSQGFAHEAGYRKLEWADVQALAQAESVELERGAQSLQMLVPWMGPGTGA